MNKLSLTIVASATFILSLASCQKFFTDEVYNSNDALHSEIRVSAMVDSPRETKAVTSTTCTTALLESFNMKAYHIGKPIIGSDSAFATYTKGEGEDATFTTVNTYYWPNAISNDTPATFFAIAENNKAVEKPARAASAAINKDGITITDYTVASNTDQDDPIYATSKVTSKVSIPDVEDVSIVFKHMLSRVTVAVAYSSVVEKGNLKIKVLGYEFRNVGMKGSATVNADGNLSWTPATIESAQWIKDMYVSDWAKSSYDYTEGAAPIDASAASFSSSEYAQQTDKIYRENSWSNVIPGTGADYLMVPCAVFDQNDQYVATRYLTKNFATSRGSYEAGKQYIYNVYITNDGGGDTDGDDDTDGDGYNDSDLSGLTIDCLGVSVTPWVTAVGGSAEFIGD